MKDLINYGILFLVSLCVATLVLPIVLRFVAGISLSVVDSFRISVISLWVNLLWLVLGFVFRGTAV